MVSQGSTAPPALWCTEQLLIDSPSTASAWSYSSTTVDCVAAPHFQNARKSTRKRPFSVLPNNSHTERLFEQFCPTTPEDPCTQNQRVMEERLNGLSRFSVPVDLDKTVHWDNRALDALLDAEKHDSYRFIDLRKMLDLQVDPKFAVYRRETIRWLHAVCLEENCDFVVFPLAVTYFNRILCLQRFPPTNLQVLAVACLFVASKMKAPQPILAPRLSSYTNDFISSSDILNWEIVIVNLLQWQLSLSTAFEFFDQLLVRAPAFEALRDSFCTVTHSMQTNERLSFLLPSQQAALALLYLTMKSPKWSSYRKIVKICLKMDFYDLKSYLCILDSKITFADLEFMQPIDQRPRRPIYENTSSPFVAFV